MERDQEKLDELAALFTPPSPAAETAIVVAPPAGALAATPVAKDPLDELVDEVFTENLKIVRNVAHFADIDPDTTVPPEAWVKELGQEAAMRRLRICRGAWLGAKDAPKALDIAKSISSSLALARVKKEKGQRELKVELTLFPAFSYGKIEVTSDE